MRNLPVPAAVLVFALSLASAPAFAAEHVLTLEPAHAKVTFFLGATGHDVQGAFPLTRCNVRFDPATGTASGEIALDAVTSTSGHPKRDRTMHAKVLVTGSNPLISFRPSTFEGNLPDSGEGDVTLTGVVTLLGKEHPLSMPTHVTRAADKVHLVTTFPIPFVEWGLEDPSVIFMKVEKVVQLTIEGDATLAEATPSAEAAHAAAAVSSAAPVPTHAGP